jgi:rsbT co-antagonist protein RsbR
MREITSEEGEQLRERIAHLENELWLHDQALQSAVNGISISDATKPDNPLIYVNPAFEHMTGYTAEDTLGKNCRFLQGPDTDPAAIEAIRAAIREGRSCLVTLLNYRKDGTPFWNEFSIAPIYDDNGTLTNFVGIQQDVTARVQAEIALHENEDRIAGILDSAMDAIITVDENHAIVLFNQAAETMFGYASDDIVGQSLDVLLPVGVRSKHHDYIRSFGQTDTHNRTMASQRRIDGLRASGEEFPIEVSISQVDAGGHKLYTAIVRDISERVQAEQERNELQERIIQMQHALVQELSTPLIPISDDIVIMPLVGSVDSLRAQNVMGTLLEGIERHRSRIVILDITGVPIVDTQVANTLIQSAQAVRLLGARVLLTGIGPDIAQTLVGLGVDLSGIVTYSTLQIGISSAMRQLKQRR